MFLLLFFGGLGRLGAPFWTFFRHFEHPGPPLGPFGCSGKLRKLPEHQKGDLAGEKGSPFSHLLAHFHKKTCFCLYIFSRSNFFINFEASREGSNLIKYHACQQNQRFGIAASRLHPGSILEVFWYPLGTFLSFFAVF